MRLWIQFTFVLTVLFTAQAQERFKAGELRGFTKLPTEHIIERLEAIPGIDAVTW